MGLIDNLINKYIRTPIREELKKEYKSEKTYEADVASWEASVGIPPTANTAELINYYRSWVFANINAIAEPVADIKWQLFRMKPNTDVIEVQRHPVLELLYKVNTYQTKYDLLYSTEQFLKLYGEAAWYLVRSETGKKMPKEIILLDPSKMRVYPNEDTGNVDHYEIRVKAGENIRLEPEEVIFFRKPNPKSRYRGVGIVEAVFTTIQSDDFAEEWNRNFYYNSARPDGILKTEQKLNPDLKKRLKDEWNNLYRGARNAKRTAILEAGLDYSIIQPTATEMDFLESMKWNRDKIMALFNNTKISLGIVEDVNRANAEASNYVHAKNVIKPEMQFITDILNEFLVPLWDEDLFLSFEDPVPENKEEKLKEYEIGWNKWMTINEIRDEQGREPIEAGDSLYLPINLLPIGSGESQEQSKTIIKEIKVKPYDIKQKRLKTRFKHEIIRLENRNIAKRVIKETLRDVATQIYKLTKGKKGKTKKLIEQMTTTERHKYMEAFWKGIIREAAPIEKTFERKFKRLVYPKLEKEVLEKLERSEKSARIKANVDRFLFDREKAIELSIAVATPILLQALKLGGDKGIQLLNIDMEFIETSAFVQKYLRDSAKKFSKSWTGELSRQVRSTLADGLKAGEGIDLLKTRIRHKFEQLSESQAWRVARTETFRAYNAGTIEAWKQSGVVVGKQWFTAVDERVCEWCEPLDGKMFGIETTVYKEGDEIMGSEGGILNNDYDDVEYPPLHPNCRCTFSPVILGQADTKPKVKEDNNKIKSLIKEVIKEYDEPQEDSTKD
jgi:HK97 family phage portal protein